MAVFIPSHSPGGADPHSSSSDNNQGRILTQKDFSQPGVSNVTGELDPDKLDRKRSINELYNELPAKRLSDPNINFFGSSYSGADIKVVAHLYESIQSDEDLQKTIAEQTAVLEAIVEGANSLLSGGLDGLAQQEQQGNFQDANRRELFVAATGLNNLDQIESKALNTLVNNIWKSSGFNFLQIARMKAAAEDTRYQFRRKVTDLKDRKKELIDIEENSSSTITLGTLQTISVQSHREKNAVRALGHTYAKSYTRGTRTIAGSMIFTMFDEHALSALIRSLGRKHGTEGEKDTEFSSLLPDQLPPLDLTIVFANEYGALSDRRLYGVEFLNDGVTHSIEDLLSESVMNFVCRDADVMTKRGAIRLSRLQKDVLSSSTESQDFSGSSLLFNNEAYNEYLEKLKVRRRTLNR